MSLQMSMDQDASLQAEAISRLLDQPANKDSYYGLWHLHTRVKWLYRTGAAEDGVATAMEAIPRIERMADRNLLERMRLLAAEGLGRTGRHIEGARMWAEAVIENPDPPLEIMAEASSVAGRLAAPDDAAAALDHFDRAGRILQSVGNLTALAEAERDAIETLGSAGSVPFVAGTAGPTRCRSRHAESHQRDGRRPSASFGFPHRTHRRARRPCRASAAARRGNSVAHCRQRHRRSRRHRRNHAGRRRV